MNKLAFIIIHVYLLITLVNLSYLIFARKPIPLSIGYLLVATTVLLIITTVYFVITSKESYHGSKASLLRHKHEKNRHRQSIDEIQKERGLHFDPKDPNYKPIGGVGGTGWL